MYTNALEKDYRISKIYNSIWIPGNKKYYLKKQRKITAQ